MAQMQTVTTAMEDYLEAIARLSGETGVARARDVAAVLNVHKSTVTAAFKTLADKALVNYSAYEAASLTPEGRRIAEDVLRRHKIVRDFFTDVLALEAGVADANACRIEHVLDPAVLQRLADFAEAVKKCPKAERVCLK
jgi:DtxR family transcriptional regulator, Mn-dependent transcriptional regulator